MVASVDTATVTQWRIFDRLLTGTSELWNGSKAGRYSTLYRTSLFLKVFVGRWTSGLTRTTVASEGIIKYWATLLVVRQWQRKATATQINWNIVTEYSYALILSIQQNTSIWIATHRRVFLQAVHYSIIHQATHRRISIQATYCRIFLQATYCRVFIQATHRRVFLQATYCRVFLQATPSCYFSSNKASCCLEVT